MKFFLQWVANRVNSPSCKFHMEFTRVFKTLLLTYFAVMGATGFAAENFSITGQVSSGVLADFSLVANLSISVSDIELSGNVYLAARVGNAWFFKDSTNNWVSWSGGPIPIFSSGLLYSQSINVVSNQDLSSPTFDSTEIYAGYGLSEADMLANNKYSRIYTLIRPLCCKQL